MSLLVLGVWEASRAIGSGNWKAEKCEGGPSAMLWRFLCKEENKSARVGLSMACWILNGVKDSSDSSC